MANGVSRKGQIQAQATTLFRQQGYNATSMRQLAGYIGIEAASLYNHITSKDDLLRDICQQVADAYLQHLNSIENASSLPSQKIKDIIGFHIDMMLQKYEQVYVSNRDWKHLKEPFLSSFLESRRNYEKRLSAIIMQGVEQGEFRQLHPHVAVLTILSAVRGIEHWQRHPKGIDAVVVKENMVDMLVRGMLANTGNKE